MMSESSNIDWNNMSNGIPAFLTVVMMPLSYSITNGIMFGLVSAFCFYFTTGQFFADVMDVVRGIDERAEGDEEEQGGASLSRTSSFAGETGVPVRKPSFLLNAGDIEQINKWERDVYKAGLARGAEERRRKGSGEYAAVSGTEGYGAVSTH